MRDAPFNTRVKFQTSASPPPSSKWTFTFWRGQYNGYRWPLHHFLLPTLLGKCQKRMRNARFSIYFFISTLYLHSVIPYTKQIYTWPNVQDGRYTTSAWLHDLENARNRCAMPDLVYRFCISTLYLHSVIPYTKQIYTWPNVQDGRYTTSDWLHDLENARNGCAMADLVYRFFNFNSLSPLSHTVHTSYIHFGKYGQVRPRGQTMSLLWLPFSPEVLPLVTSISHACREWIKCSSHVFTASRTSHSFQSYQLSKLARTLILIGSTGVMRSTSLVRSKVAFRGRDNRCF